MMRYLLVFVAGLVAGVILAFSVMQTTQPNPRQTKPAVNRNSNSSVEELVKELPREKKLRQQMAYLKNISEVNYVEIEDNNVYIGFYTLPHDLTTILRAAAFRGNRATSFGVHVWGAGVGAAKPGWRPGDKAFWWQCVTARYGKIEPGSVLVRRGS